MGTGRGGPQITHSTVLDMLRRAERAGITLPLPDLDDAAMETQLYQGNPVPDLKRPEADMGYILQELRRKEGTLQLLWWEYKQAHLDGLLWICGLTARYGAVAASPHTGASAC